MCENAHSSWAAASKLPFIEPQRPRGEAGSSFQSPLSKEFIINTMSFVLACALSQAEAESIAHAPNQNLEHLQ
jgi:hypothetical protein